MAAESTFNYFLGALALLSTLFSMLVYLNMYLPAPRMKLFDELLVETKRIYAKASAEGLLPPNISIEARDRLSQYELQGDDLRAITYRALSPIEVLLSFFGGLSSRIASLSRDLMELRGMLLTTSQKERASRQEALRTQERTGSADSTLHSMLYQGGSEGDRPECCREPESFSHPTTDALSATSSPSATSSSILREFPYSPFCIRSFTQWLSWKRASPSPPQHEGENYDPSTSRSSTLVQDPLPEGLSTDAPWSRLARWVRPADPRTRHEDLEAKLSVPISSISHDSGRAPCES